MIWSNMGGTNVSGLWLFSCPVSSVGKWEETAPCQTTSGPVDDDALETPM